MFYIVTEKAAKQARLEVDEKIKHFERLAKEACIKAEMNGFLIGAFSILVVFYGAYALYREYGK